MRTKLGVVNRMLKIWQAKPAIYLGSTLCLVAVAVIDSVTGPEVTLSVFYLLPGILVAWCINKTSGFMAASIASVTWLLVELNFGRNYQHPIVPYCNGMLQLAMALFCSFLTAAVREREQAVREEAAGRKRAETLA